MWRGLRTRHSALDTPDIARERGLALGRVLALGSSIERMLVSILQVLQRGYDGLGPVEQVARWRLTRSLRSLMLAQVDGILSKVPTNHVEMGMAGLAHFDDEQWSVVLHCAELVGGDWTKS